MITVTLQRDKCIGCNYCTEYAPQRFVMSKKDGKATLLNAVQKRETWVLPLNEIHREKLEQVIVGCPVKVIKVL